MLCRVHLARRGISNLTTTNCLVINKTLSKFKYELLSITEKILHVDRIVCGCVRIYTMIEAQLKTRSGRRVSRLA